MSIFKDAAIVLKINKIKGKEHIITLFSFEYGKIQIAKKYSKTEKNIDIGYIINFEIITKENQTIHKIRNIRIKSEFNNNGNKKFRELYEYLEILSLLYIKTPLGIPHKEIFHIIEYINSFEKISRIQIILSELKILSFLGILHIEHKNIKIQKILHFVHYSKIENIFRLVGINDTIENELKNIIKNT